jgi:hypothetical protein
LSIALLAIEALTGGALEVVNAVNDAKAARKELEEVQYHNRAIGTTHRGLYLSPYKRGSSWKRKKKKKESNP